MGEERHKSDIVAAASAALVVWSGVAPAGPYARSLRTLVGALLAGSMQPATHLAYAVGACSTLPRRRAARYPRLATVNGVR